MGMPSRTPIRVPAAVVLVLAVEGDVVCSCMMMLLDRTEKNGFVHIVSTRDCLLRNEPSLGLHKTEQQAQCVIFAQSTVQI